MIMKMSMPSPKSHNKFKEVKDPNFYLGNDSQNEKESPIKSEIVEENSDSEVEMIQTPKETSFDADDQSIQNLIEESENTKTEIKEEPGNDYNYPGEFFTFEIQFVSTLKIK
jgi:hypothetical protein